jgi:hypothetical protein
VVGFKIGGADYVGGRQLFQKGRFSSNLAPLKDSLDTIECGNGLGYGLADGC